MRKVFFIVGLVLLASIACKHQMVVPGTSTSPIIITNPGTGGGSTSNPSDTVCFNSEVLPLYQSYCASAGCHSAASARSGVVTTDYFNIMKGIRANSPNSSKYYTILFNGMPPRGSPQMTAAQVATIQKWITQGALNTLCVTTTCDSTKTTYSNGISTLFATYCNGCHGVAPGSGNIILGDYTNAKNTGISIKQSFLNDINYAGATAAKNMPPAGKLSSCQILQITKWINNGCPQ
ncbi:MAG: hypothetical protein WCG74_01905 [Sediminibacterium sp.]